MIEIALLFCIILFSVFAKKSRIVHLVLFLLPFHTFIKSVFEYFFQGGGIFSGWKELVVLIFLARVFSGKRLQFNKSILLYLQLFFVIILAYFFTGDSYSESLATLRDHLFPVLLFVALYCCPLDLPTVRTGIVAFSIAVFINCIMGFVQNFYLNIPISTLMGRIDFIDSSGYIQYKTTSARILGIERMAGILGGPNIFGLFYSFVVIFFLGVLLNIEKFGFSGWYRKFLRVLLVLSLACLLFSFSRAGWVIALLGSGILLKISGFRLNFRYFLFIIPAAIVAFTAILEYFPQVSRVFNDSISGKEASVADRSNNFNRGLEMNMTEPFGHGLGTTDHRNINYEFFSESAFMNIGYEIGVLGLLYLLFLHFQLLRKMLKYRSSEFRPFAKIAICVSIPTLIACFVSINPYGMPCIYLWWVFLGLGLNNSKMVLLPTRRKVTVRHNELQFSR